ncbi:MAG: phage Gp37/Gp68 family protein [Desulfitobacteriaceae bacterium]|nr:phage Gp37/Gp68 family protein [Desulfitobacteriaceae bacterium]
MALKSKIEWTENTWNPVTGCTRISDGCQNCYACTLANRLKLMGSPKYANGFKVTLHSHCLGEPLRWKKPSLVFVNSMSDLFHEDVPFEFINQVFEVMNHASQHTFQVLTKRAERMAELASSLNWTPNIWQGVTVESDHYKYRMDCLRKVPAKIRFVSFEPLIDEVKNIDFSGIDWAIVGGESGFRARAMQLEWILSIKNQCESQGTLFYFKQWGGVNKKKAGRILLGQTWDDMPNMKI